MGDSLSIQNKFAANSQACSRTNHFIKLLWQCFIPGWPPLPHWLFPWFLSVPSVGECSGHEISFPDKPQQSIRKWGSLLALTHCKTDLNAQVDQKLFIDHQSALVMLCSKYPPLTSSSQPPLWPHLLTPPPPPSLSPIIKLTAAPHSPPRGSCPEFQHCTSNQGGGNWLPFPLFARSRWERWEEGDYLFSSLAQSDLYFEGQFPPPPSQAQH